MNVLSEAEQLEAQVMAEEMFDEAVEKIREAMASAIVAEDAAYFTGKVSELTLSRARRLADTAAKSLVQDLTKAALKKIGETAAKSLAQDLAKAELKKIGETIAQAMIDGKRPLDIYNKLQEVKSLDSNRAKTYDNLKKKLEQSGLSPDAQKKLLDKEYQRLLQERRKTIAQTEGRYATSEARAAAADERKDEFKRWITSPDERLCEVCDGNENDGVIPINESFSSGDMHTPAHPNCRCTVAYLSGGKDKEISEKRVARKIAAKREARKIAAKQKAKEERQNVEELDK